MGKYAEKEWYLKHSKQLIEKYGDVPPPWIYEPKAHPYNICWRMGGGESHVMVLWEWLDQENKSQGQRIEYLRKYPPPVIWLRWAADFIWELGEDSWEEDFDWLPYFNQLKELGFEGVEDFEKEFNDDKWI